MASITFGIQLGKVNESIDAFKTDMITILSILSENRINFLTGYMYDVINDITFETYHLDILLYIIHEKKEYNSLKFVYDNKRIDVQIIFLEEEYGLEIIYNYDDYKKDLPFSITRLHRLFDDVDFEYAFVDYDQNLEYSTEDLKRKIKTYDTLYPILMYKEGDDLITHSDKIKDF